MDFDTIIKDIEQRIEANTMKLEYLNKIITKNKVEDIFSFIKALIDKSPIIDNYLFTFFHGKKQNSEEEIYKSFGETNGNILYSYATLKGIVAESNLDYSYEDYSNLSAESLFYTEMREIPILSKDVTNDYIIKFQEYKRLHEESSNADEKEMYKKKYVFYQNQVIEGNIRLVVSIANKKNHPAIEKTDLINEGVLGMVRAMQRFDTTLGFSFSTYATLWIRQSINRAIEEKGRTIRIPSFQYQVYNKYLVAMKKLSYELGRDPSLEEIATYLKMDLSKLTELVLSFSDTPSLDATTKDNDEKEQSNMFNYLKSGEFEDRVIDSLTSKELFSGLTEQEKTIIELRYMQGLTLENVGKMFGLTRERIRQIEKNSLRKMNRLSKVIKKTLSDYINIPNEEILKIVSNFDNDYKTILYKEFGNKLNKKVVTSKFNEKDIKIIISKIEEQYHQMLEKKSQTVVTLEDLLNEYPKGSLEYEETSKKIRILWEKQDKNALAYKMLVRAFGTDGKGAYNQSEFTKGENKLILNNIEVWKHKLRKWPRNINRHKTLEELLNNGNNKEDYEELNRRIAYLWEKQNENTVIYSIMVKAFGKDGKSKCNVENLTAKEIDLVDKKILNWKSKLKRIDFWPKKHNESKIISKDKYLWELLQITKDELAIIINSLNKNTKFYQLLLMIFGSKFDKPINLQCLTEKDSEYFHTRISFLRKKINEPTPYFRKTLREILNQEIPEEIKKDYLLRKAFGKNLDQPYLNTLSVVDSRKLIFLITELKKKYKSTTLPREEIPEEKKISPEEIVFNYIVGTMPENIKESFMMYFGLTDGIKYCPEDIQLKLNINLSKVIENIKAGIKFVEDTLKTYKNNFDENYVDVEQILRRLK